MPRRIATLRLLLSLALLASLLLSPAHPAAAQDEPAAPSPAAEPPAARGDGQFVRSAILHDSRSDLYRTPFGAQPVATDVTLRLRTAANDVESVTLVVNNLDDGSGSSRALTKVVSDGQFDWWQAAINTGPVVTVHNYHFALADGDAAAFYVDDGMRDGGEGILTTAPPPADAGWDIYTYAEGFDAPAWAANATIYQIFPDRFRNGEAANDPSAADWFYPEERGRAFPIAPWNTPVPDPIPEDPNQNPDWYGTFSSTFYGGDLQGVQEKLDYLQDLGVTALYFNPIFDSPSNHRYDGRDYRQVDDNLAVAGDAGASNAFFTELAAAADARGMQIILDGVPNHTSSDSPLFDRYARHDVEGACESETSPYRGWYIFTPARPQGSGVCAGDTNYAAWAGFATLPQVDTADAEVIDNWMGPEGIATSWLRTPGVDGWRIDVVPDVVLINPRFFELLRTAAKEANPDALLVSETWQERDARARVLGDEFDTSMNYRFRQAVLGFLREEDFADNDGTIVALAPTEFDAALRAVQEDYPPAAFATAMNLISSHDVNRAVYVLDHDGVNAERTAPVNGFADGRRRLALAAALQFTLPGAPTVYYGDEVGLVGFGSDPLRDDPYNRQPYPWEDAAGYSDLPAWRQADADLLALYRQLGALRREHTFLRTGSWDTLAADDATGLYAYGRKDATGAALVVFNRSSAPLTATLELQGYIPADALLEQVAISAPPGDAGSDAGSDTGSPSTRNEEGALAVTVPGLDFRIYVTAADADMRTPAAPTVDATEGNRELSLAIAQGEASSATVDAVEFVVLRSLVDGGFAEIGRLPAAGGAVFADGGVANGTTYYYQVVAIGANGLASPPTATGPLIPHAPILSITVDEPLVLQHTLSAVEPSPESRAAVNAPGITEIAGAGAGLRAQIGWAPAAQADDPSAFTWADAVYVTDNQGGSNVYGGRMLPDSPGDYVFAWRATTTGGREWTLSENRGKLTVYPAADTEAPKPPFRLDPVARSGSQVSFAWRVARGPDLYNFRICRADLTGGEAGCATRFDVPKETGIYTDTAVTAGSTYTYTVQAVDTSFNVSTPSNPITLTAELSMVDVTFRVRVPPATPPDDLIFIAGDNTEAFGASYNPGLQPLEPVGDNLWEYTTRLQEGTRLQYKYTRGSWETVEQWGTISGMANRQLQVVAGPDNTMLVDDTATDWGGDGPDDRRGVQTWRDPLVAAVTPAQGSSGPVETVQAEFTALVTAGEPATVLTVSDAGGNAVAGSVAGADSRTFVFTPAAPLAPGDYTATVFNVATDTPMVAPYQWTFTVAE
jgi:glycosidase